MIWVTLLLTAIGCVPYAGDVVKAGCKAIIKGADDIVLKILRKLDADDVQKAFKILRSKFTSSIDDASAMVNKWIEKAGNSKYGSKINEVLTGANENLRKASDLVTSKIDEFGEKIFGNGKFIKNTIYPKKIKWGIHEIDVRPEGKGFWGKRIKQADPRVEAFELKINPNNESYYLPHPQGGYVQFENMINSTVQDGKLILNKKSFYHVDDMPDFAKNKILQEAQRQIDSAILANYKVEWLISDKSAVEQLKKLFEKNNIKIEIKFFPE